MDFEIVSAKGASGEKTGLFEVNPISNSSSMIKAVKGASPRCVRTHGGGHLLHRK